MTKFLAALAVAAMLAVPFAGVSVQAEESGDLCSYCWDKGEFTEANPVASRTLLLPVRLVSAGVGAPVGAIYGVGEAVPPAMKAVSRETFEEIPTTEFGPAANAVVTLVKAPVLFTAGVVGSVVALPVSATYGFVKGTGKGLAKGFMYPDTF